MNEFNLIQHFFAKQPLHRPDVLLGIGDDAALLNIPPKKVLAITTDTLVSGVHFLEDTSPYDIGYKSLAVSLSDLAAMGAKPAWITLNLTIPQNYESWLAKFSEGLLQLAVQYEVQLIGGDLTSGPLSISVQALGLLPKNQSLRRDGAKVGDLICVTNTLGDAAAGLLLTLKKKIIPEKYKSYFLERLHRPQPQVIPGQKLLTLAHAAIDISDGLVADLSHILKKSAVGAKVYIERLPLSLALLESFSYNDAFELALTGGDDYELCFTIPKEKVHELDFRWTAIGVITEEKEIDFLTSHGEKINLLKEGYMHFN